MLSLKEYLQSIESKEKSFRKPELESGNQIIILAMQIDIIKEMLYELSDELDIKFKELENKITKKSYPRKTILTRGKTAWDKKQKL